jgi:hypothetical protein
MSADIITMYGERSVWLRFTHVVKLKKKKIWETLSPLLLKYIEENEKEGDEKNG